MKRKIGDVFSPCIEIDGRAHRVRRMSDALIEETRDKIEDATGEEGTRCEEVGRTIVDADPRATLTSSRAYVEAFAGCYDASFGRWFSFQRAS